MSGKRQTIPAVALVFAAAWCSVGAGDGFLQIAGRRAIIPCGQAELRLDGERGFSLALAARHNDAAQPLLTSTSVRLWLDGQDQMVVSRGHVVNLAILEEGPQRVVVRAPFTLSGRDGRPLATAQYDLVCYPEGELFVTLRVLPLREEEAQAAIELRFAHNEALRFERACDLPLLAGAAPSGPAVGLYWHNGDAPVMGVIGDQMRCLLACQAETEGDATMISRSFVISLAPTRDDLRRRCLAHIEPLRPLRMQSCRPLVESTPEAREGNAEFPGWCYSFREGTYNVLADGPRAEVEFVNRHEEPRHVRLRFVGRDCPALQITATNSVGGEAASCGETQVVSLAPDSETKEAGQSAATLSSFDLGAEECLLARAERTDRVFLQFVGARFAQGTIRRQYRLVTGDPNAGLGQVQITDGGPSAGIELASLAAPTAAGSPTVAALSATPGATETWGRFSRLTDLAIVRNRPDRAIVQATFLNEPRTLSCQTNLVFRRDGATLSLHGYHSLEALEPLRGLRPTTLDLPSFRFGGGAAKEANRPARFFYADSRKQIQICPQSAQPGFGYEIGGFNRSVHPDFALCGFSGGSSAGLVFLGRSLSGAGKMAAAESSPVLSMRLELPAAVARGQRFDSMWQMVMAGTGETNLRALQQALGSLKGRPVEVGWTARQITVGDGHVAHRVFELSPSGNPASDDARAYLIDGGNELAVVSAGTDALRWPWLFRIRALGFDPGRVRKILLTDVSADQAGGARALKQLTGAAIHLHASATEALSVAGPDQDQRTDTLDRNGSDRFESVGADRPLRDGEKIAVGDVVIRFLHTPGPSGEAGTYLANAGGLSVAFAGDLLAADDSRSTSSGARADAHRHANLDEWVRSLRRLRAENVDLVAPSCSPPLSGTERINALCDQAIKRYTAVLRVKNIDTVLPRPLVAGPELRGDTASPVARDELWGVKETAALNVTRTRPIQISDSIWRVGGGMAGEPEDANVFLVDGGGEMALIGAGSGLHTRAILDRIRGLSKNPLDINYILLPSSHWYEARGANSLRAATRARVCAHRFETAALWRGDVLRTGLLIGDFAFAAFPPCRVDRALEWGETLRVGRQEITVLDAPGFHRGSTAFWMIVDGLRFLAVGQTALGDLPLPNDEIADGALGWLDPHWGGNVPAWRQTLERFLALQPDVILPGQGPAQDEELERQLKECLARLDQIQKIQAATGLFPESLFDAATAPVRPDITRLLPKR